MRSPARPPVMLLAALGLFAALAARLPGATYTWNSTGVDWTTAANWSPAGPPAIGDTALFSPNGAALGATVQNPSIAGLQQTSSLTVAPNHNMSGWNFGGSGTLVLGGSGSTGLTTYGPVTAVFNGPALEGAAGGGSVLNFNLMSGSTVALAGNSTATTNLGVVNINGSTLRLDNSAIALSRLAGAAANAMTLNNGGVLELVGNGSTSFTQTVGNLTTNQNSIGGVNVIRVAPNGQNTTLNFTNANAVNLRPGTRAAIVFEAASGNLGDAGGAQVTFAGTPNRGAGGLLAASNNPASQTVGFALVRDGLGTNWATWTPGIGIISVANPNSGVTITTVSDAAGLSALTASSVAQFNPAAGSTITPGAAVTAASLRISPSGSGSVLAMDANNLQTNATMLDGAHDFAITGTGTLSAGATRYVYVNNANARLSIGLNIAGGTNSTVFAGPGFVELTGAGSQNSLSTTNRFVIAGGTVRGNNTQIGFTPAGAGIISLTGGVLEIKDGANGPGASADFTRALGAAAGNVTWGAGTANEIGSGGFSAFGSNASVNIGGADTPANLQWGQSNFVADGYALKFGSIRSNAVLTFLNPLQLDNGAAPCQIREIQVIGGVGGDRTVFAGVISGAASADLLKTGSGTLELTAANTFSGNTLIQQGTLVASNGTGSATGSGTVKVYAGGTLRGTGTIAGPASGPAVLVGAGGTLAPGGVTNTGALTINNSVSFADSSAVFSIRANGGAVGNGTTITGYDQLAVTSGTVSLNNATLNLSVGYSPGSNDRLLIVNNTDGAVTLSGTFNGHADGSTFAAGGHDWKIYYGASADAFGGSGGNDVVIVPVPEPAHILLFCALVGGAGYALRRVRRRAN